MPTDQLKIIDLSDFSPGIHGDIHTGLGNTARGAVLRNGAATIADTFRCVADATGALIPLPKRVAGTTQTLIPGGNGNNTTNFYPAGQIGSYLQDAYISGEMTTGSNVAPNATPYTVYTLWNFNYQPAGTGTPYYNLWLGRAYRKFTVAPSVKDFYWESSNPNTFTTALSRIKGGTLCSFRSQVSLTFGWATFYPGIAIVTQGFFNHAAIPIVAAELPLTTYDTDNVNANYPSGLGTDESGSGNGWFGLLAYHPAPGSTGTNSTVRDPYPQPFPAISYEAFGASFACGHQGRVVVACKATKPLGAAGFAETHADDFIYYTTSLIMLAGAPDHFAANAMNPENASGISMIVSANTDELLVVHNRNGGFVVRGDMTNPTITALRSIEPMYGVQQTPAHTPIGIVYCTPNGVFVWQGGETTPKLSPQLDSNFWDYATGESTDIGRRRGKLSWFHPWVCVPNNYLYDTELKSWWRLEDPTTNNSTAYSIYEIEPQTGRLFAFPYKLTGTQNVVWDEYDAKVQASSYSWRSQPLVESNERLMSYQEIELVASSGKGTTSNTVTVTLTGIDENGAVVSSPATSFVFTGTGATNGSPYIKRKQIVTSLIAKHVQVLITSTNSASDPAPKIHSVKIGYADRNRSAKG